MLVLTANIFKQRKMWKHVKSKVIIDVLLMTQEMKVIILQENSAAGNRGHIVVSVKTGWPTNAILSCPDDDDEHLTNNSTSNLYLSLPRVPGTLTSGHWRLSDKTPQHHHYQCCWPPSLHLQHPGPGLFCPSWCWLVNCCQLFKFFILCPPEILRWTPERQRERGWWEDVHW